ncbi:MAG: tetratricopeptide repeat protein, partial [Planctomycetota bacterium]
MLLYPLYSRAACLFVAAAFLACAASARGEASPAPGDAGARYTSALKLLKSGKRTDAAVEMIAALRAFSAAAATPSKPVPAAEKHFRAGVQQMRVRHDSLAEKEFKKAIELDPGHAGARYQLAFLLGNRGDYAEMFRETWRAIRTRPLESEKLRAIGGLALMAGRVPEATSAYREALEKTPSSPEVLRMLGLVLVESGRKEEGFALLQKSLDAQPGDYSTLSSLGLAYALSGDYPKAEDALGKAIEINREHPEALARRGMVFLIQGRAEDSIRQLDEAVRSNPGSAELHANLAKAYKVQGKLDEAERHYTLALKADPENYDG